MTFCLSIGCFLLPVASGCFFLASIPSDIVSYSPFRLISLSSFILCFPCLHFFLCLLPLSSTFFLDSSGYFFSIKARADSQIKALHFASERDYDNLGFQLYTRPGPFSSFTSSASGWAVLIDTRLRNVHKFDGVRSRLNSAVFPSPIRLAAGEEQSFYLFTPENCRIGRETRNGRNGAKGRNKQNNSS